MCFHKFIKVFFLSGLKGFRCGKIVKKLVEEAAESWLAAEHESKERTAEELSQLVYHIQCMMIAKGISLSELYATL